MLTSEELAELGPGRNIAVFNASRKCKCCRKSLLMISDSWSTEDPESKEFSRKPMRASYI